MICWISGLACSGKSTLIKSILNNVINFPNTYEIFKPIKKINCIRFNNNNFLLVGSNYLNDKSTEPGIDGSRSNQGELESLINQEYLNHNILLETFLPHYFNIDLISRLVNRYELKIFYLHADKSILDERGIKRNHWFDKSRTEKIKINQLKRIESVISNNLIKPYVKILKNNNEKDLSNNVKLICEYITQGVNNGK